MACVLIYAQKYVCKSIFSHFCRISMKNELQSNYVPIDSLDFLNDTHKALNFEKSALY